MSPHAHGNVCSRCAGTRVWAPSTAAVDSSDSCSAVTRTPRPFLRPIGSCSCVTGKWPTSPRRQTTSTFFAARCGPHATLVFLLGVGAFQNVLWVMLCVIYTLLCACVQMYRQFRKPLIVASTKALLRHKLALSDMEEFAPGLYGFTRLWFDAWCSVLWVRPGVCSAVVWCGVV